MQPTKDHDSIRLWATKYDAVPAEIQILKFDGEPSLLYFLFGKAREGTPDLRPITWDDFFARFDLLGLSMVFDDSPQFEIVRVQHSQSTEVRLSN